MDTQRGQEHRAIAQELKCHRNSPRLSHPLHDCPELLNWQKNFVDNHQNKLNFPCNSQRYCIFCCLQQQRGAWSSVIFRPVCETPLSFRCKGKVQAGTEGNAIHLANTYQILGGKSDIRFNEEDTQRRLPHRREPYQGRRILGSDGHAGRWRGGGRPSGVHLNYIKACINVL